MRKIWKRVCTGILALATVITALPITSVHAAETQYWTESAERVGYIEHVMNDGTIHSTFNEGHMKVEGETAYCVDINTNFQNGYKTRHDASASMSAAQIEDVALSLEYVKQYTGSHTNLNANQRYLLEQCVVWQRLSEYLGWQCDNVRAAYSEISQDIQNEVYAGARAFVQENKGRYKCGGYIYTGQGQDVGQFWAELNVGNAKVKKATANASVTDGNALYSIAGATFGVFSDQNCNNQIGTLTTDENVVTIYVPEGQKWKLADIKSDMSNILLNGCEIENGAVQTDSGDVFFKNCDFNNLKVKTDMGNLCFIGKEDVMRTWNIQMNTDMGDINVDDALTGKMVEDQDDCDISYTQKGTGGNLVIQTDSGNIRLKCR